MSFKKMRPAGSWLRGSAVLVLLLGGCAAQTAPGEPADPPEGTVERTASALVAFDPCHPDWQLPTWARYALQEPDHNFVAFESRLEAGGALWIGNMVEVPKPWRAIVRVDHYLEGTKKDPHSGLWFLAAIPVGSADALAAVDFYAPLDPVHSRALGYCLAGGGFLPNKGSGPGNAAITHVIAEYDPRCVCVGATATMQVWVDRPTYESTANPSTP
jgi:hypothetical protein